MRRHVHNILAALLCVCLLVSYTPLPASGAEASVGEPAPFVEGQASTTVSVMTVGLSIAGKTDDITTSVADIMKDAALPNSEHTYLLKVVLSGADPADCSFTWTRGVVAADGTVRPDPAFSDTHADHALVDDAQAGLLQTGTTYRYTVEVSDASTGQSASASVDVTISDDYLDRTLAHASGVTVTGPILRELTDEDLTAETIDPASPLYAALQEAARGMELRAAWQAALPAGSGGKEALSGPVHVSLPAEVEDGAEVSVIMLGADGVPAVVDGEARNGLVTVEAAGLGAFAVAVPVARTFTVTATCGEGGSVSPAGSKEYAEGATPLYTFLPNTGFGLDAVTVDGQTVKPVFGRNV